VHERPSRSVSFVSQTWDQSGVSVSVAEAFLEDLEDGGDGNVADAGMPDDIGDEIEDDGHLVRVEGPIEHPSDAKRIRDESHPVDFLPLENQRNVLTQDYFHFPALFVRGGECVGLTSGSCSRLEVIATGLCGRKRAHGFPDTIRKTPAKDAQESWSDRAGDNEDDTQDLCGGDGNRCGPFVLRPKVISEDVCDNEEGGLEHEGECLDEESGDPGEITVKGAGRPVPTLVEGGRVQIHDRISFEGLFSEDGEKSNEEGSR